MRGRNDGIGKVYASSAEQKEYAWRLVCGTNFGHRGEFDGDRRHQYAGMLGQTILADAFGLPRPVDLFRQDGGTDFVVGGKEVDLKTALRRTEFGRRWPVNLKASQFEFGDARVYLFASMLESDASLNVIGWIKKIDVRREWRKDAGTPYGPSSSGRYPTDTIVIPAAALAEYGGEEPFFHAMTMFG